MSEQRISSRALISWALYDWGNSAFSAIIQTFVFAAYFTQHVAPNETSGAAQWGFINGLAALAVAISAPILGCIVDQGKRRKAWIAVFTYLCIITTAFLWMVTPDPSNVVFALVVVGIAITSSELAFVFYNAMLPALTTPDKIGRWSGWGWSLGYAGGVSCLILALFAFINGKNSWFDLNNDPSANIRATFLLVAIWYFIFSLPMFIFTPDTSGKGKNIYQALRDGFRELRNTLLEIRNYRQIVRFLIARMFYVDGLTTLFAFGGVYAATAVGMNTQQILLFGIALHITSGIGAAAFAWLDDLIGGKRLILISLVGLTVPTTILLFFPTPNLFWTMGLILGLFVGPVQSASRSLMARMAPKHLRNEMFGFFALSGKATAFLGPLLVGWLILMTGSHQVGMSVIVVFYLIGFALMLTV